MLVGVRASRRETQSGPKVNTHFITSLHVSWGGGAPMCLCIFVWKSRGCHKEPSSIMLHVLVGGSISHWTWSLLFWRRVVEQALGLTCICIPARMLQRRATVSSFYVDSWDLNLGPCACTESTFPSAFSPWPLSRGSTSSVLLHFPFCSLEATSLPFFRLIFKKRAAGMAPALPPRLQPLQLPVKYEVFPLSIFTMHRCRRRITHVLQ